MTSERTGPAGVNSSIGHILVPKMMMHGGVASRPAVWVSSGRRLQFTKDTQRRDHVPAVLMLHQSSFQIRPGSGGCRLDRDAIMRCLLQGEKHQGFFEVIEQTALRKEEDWNGAVEKKILQQCMGSCEMYCVVQLLSVFP